MTSFSQIRFSIFFPIRIRHDASLQAMQEATCYSHVQQRPFFYRNDLAQTIASAHFGFQDRMCPYAGYLVSFPFNGTMAYYWTRSTAVHSEVVEIILKTFPYGVAELILAYANVAPNVHSNMPCSANNPCPWCRDMNRKDRKRKRQ